jgi:protein tyrosine phosphatase (PTP) superfamily phosphohydrolase (DUF442 family)
MIRHLFLAASILTASGAHAEEAQRSSIEQAAIEQVLTTEEPRVLCIDDNLAGGKTPTQSAYAKAAGSGFRSVLTLRNPKDRGDLVRERFMVEKSGLRYFNISADESPPRTEQVDQFLQLTRDRSNHPMLINCAFADRVTPFMLIFRIIEQHWSQERALEEAARSGSTDKRLKKFAADYVNRERSRSKQKSS